jgi:hypothetical protein
LLSVAGVADAILGFHSQQSVEKALKAALASREIAFPYKHDLDRLIEGIEVRPVGHTTATSRQSAQGCRYLCADSVCFEFLEVPDLRTPRRV